MKLFYNKILSICTKEKSERILYLISFVESSLFPIPIIFLMIPVQLAKQHKAIRIGFWVTISSVLGGILGYSLGYFFYDLIGIKIISFFGYQDQFANLTSKLSKNIEFWIVFFYAFTPFPYKLLTIGSGFVKFNFWVFIISSLISRGIRFLTISVLIWKFGNKIKNFLDKYFNIIIFLITIFIVVSYLLIKFLF